MSDSTEKKAPEDAITTANAEPLSPEAAAPASTEASAPELAPSLQVQLEEAQAKVKAWEEEYLRARAEMENLRKRSAQEVLNAGKFAIEGFAEALLPVADSLEMALTLEHQTPDGLKGGVELTLKQLQQAFQKGRLTAIHPVGEKFDPNRHQAVSMVDGNAQNPPVPSNHVVQVMQKGYMVAERVLRPAIVVVAQ
ncbi:MAG: nucleotide exchange factor GrpE [Betaproteobacteria bacterium]|nr:nucleotide exchange factor GrpE [Betaproteobacteria bacterium]